MIPMTDCEVGRVYGVGARSFDAYPAEPKGDEQRLSIAVYCGDGRFIGIRTKFGSRYLFTEYHHDSGSPFNTVQPCMGIVEVPRYIKLSETLRTIDRRSGRAVAFDRPTVDGGRGWYFIDTQESDQGIRPQAVSNRALFDFLDALSPDSSKEDRMNPGEK